MELITRAMEFAVTAHKLVGHQRRYTGQPYEVHLSRVARLVASVTDDPEMVAAAWLHDSVEDTTATLADVEREFGRSICALVEELTDVSKPSDGARRVRKEIDRRHLADASRRAKTVKLADLIDNSRNLVKHDPRFAEVYLLEMTQLLEVLQEGDPRLYQQARRSCDEGLRQLNSRREKANGDERETLTAFSRKVADLHLTRMFSNAFTALDIARPLRSFDVETPATEVREIVKSDPLEFVCLQINGLIKGYARLSDLGDGLCGVHFRPFRASEIVDGNSSPSEIVHVLTVHPYAFVTVLGEVTGVIGRGDINKPVARMWLFGIITAVETALIHLVNDIFPNESWRDRIPLGRLEKALALHQERERRQQPCLLLECLQLSDKAQLLIEHPDGIKLFGFSSRRAALRGFRELESLRNNLAHSQDIATYDWAAIARIAEQLEGLSLQQKFEAKVL